ncbi:protein FAR1-RELATED SEQUENCE 5-like [Apium graveolens]|uniref:protein FAR1-RELATED SEQUENCE 5-like n=1 Tax=Apium graveolens TaxID=4045 RepID=UPI003D7B06D6
MINRQNTRHWEITSLDLNYNHDVVSPSEMSLIKREQHVTAAQKNLIKSLHVSGIAPIQQMNIFGKMHGGEEQVGFLAQHLRNVVRDFRKDNLGVNHAQAGLDLLHMLEEESGGNFFIRTIIDEEGRLKCLFWVDPRSLLDYKSFGDVVAFDTTYRTNRYDMPFVPFTGVNHHYQSVLFGFTLMRDELKTTFEWVLGTWLEAVEGKVPLAIITDQDQAMEEFKGDFNNCIYHSLTEEIFEDRWKVLILKYKLEDNTWL